MPRAELGKHHLIGERETDIESNRDRKTESHGNPTKQPHHFVTFSKACLSVPPTYTSIHLSPTD